MAKLQIVAGTTSKLLDLFIQDSSSTTGAGLTGLAFNTASLTAYYYREGAASATAITLATQTLGTWATGGFIVVDGTNMPGCYQLSIPNAAIAAGAKSCLVMLKGATNMAPIVLEIELTAVDNQDSVRMGMTALPNAAAAASGGLLINGSNAGTVTLAALTVTGTMTVSDGIVVTRSSSNATAINATGNGTGHGILATSGSGATGNGVSCVAASTNGHGFTAGGLGAGHGIVGTGGATGDGVRGNGGATSGAGVRAQGIAGNSNGFTGVGQGSGAGAAFGGGVTGAGVLINGGPTSGNGVEITTTSGDGVNIQPTAGHGILATANGTSKHGMVLTGSASGTGDGLKAVAGAGGVDFRGNITGTLTTVTTATNLTNAPSSGDLTATMKASVNAEVVDALNVDTYAQIGQSTPAATASIQANINFLAKMAKNKVTNDGTTVKVYNSGGGTVDQISTVSETAGIVTRGEFSTGP